MKVVYWGTYDKGKPRNRILLTGLRDNGVTVTECHKGLWDGIEDKSQMNGLVNKLMLVLRWLFSYPALIVQYLRLPAHDVTMVGYLGHLDVLILWPFAKIKRQPLVWDAFISLYDTVVNDRTILKRYNPIAKCLFAFEWLSCKAADMVLLDTEAHASYFRKNYALSADKCTSVFVGVETEQFSPVKTEKTDDPGAVESHFNILFYGQFIPLHGIETIVRAAALLRDEHEIYWTLIGTGQEKEKIEKMVEELSLPLMTLVEWVEYRDLQAWIYRADICLGIFGVSGKASRVIPNKVYQIIACGKPFITRESDAIHELFPDKDEGVFLVDAGDPGSLAEKVKFIYQNRDLLRKEPFFLEKRQQISPYGVSHELKTLLQTLI